MELSTLLAHSAWSTRSFVNAAQEQGWSDRPARLLSHIVLGEAMWLDRIEGTPLDGDIFRILTSGGVAERSLRNLDRLQRQLKSEENRVIEYVRLNGDRGSSTITEIALHVITHGFHHRGQVASWFSEQKLPCPKIDLITYFQLLKNVPHLPT